MNFYTHMDSKFLTEQFLPVVENPDEIEFVLLSSEVKSRDELKNVQPLESLVPPAYVINTLESSKKQYKTMYSTFLSAAENEYKLAIITKALVDNPKMSVVFVCSPDEDEYGYAKLLVREMEMKFGLPSTPAKKVVKMLKDGKAKKLKFEDTSDVEATVNMRIEALRAVGVDQEPAEFEQALIDLNHELQELSKKELRTVAKKMGAKVDKGMGPGKLRDKILKQEAKRLAKEKKKEAKAEKKKKDAKDKA